MRYHGAQEAVGRLFALAQALTNDYKQFEALVEEGEAPFSRSTNSGSPMAPGRIQVEGKSNIQTKVVTTLFAEVERDLISERTPRGSRRRRD